ncbi:isopentenyl-diphosphate Delta-isomerase [Salipiger sp. P9]|uniref:isopentenyl-diphosphate Delta-isomerase n=1 Tax=Salipiger pentaromativorans TaxID=2943193 RepID=UPI0021581884|nr:isopentenyl-diphosphate Delta-isomerase [Salipiger pentaromativorans]MCR8549530.1 isopentenyl-diphosphate Delta-isomerase [Salipiger pentaromativorans]
MNSTIPAWVNGTLAPVDKIDAHLRGLRHKAVSVFVLRGDSVLIQRRALGKYHTPGLWANTCCTHPHWEETPEHCAQRRLEEELGIRGLALQPRGQVEYRAEVGGGMTEHELVDIFVAEASESLKIEPNPAEVMDVAWISLDDLAAQTARDPERFTPWLRIYLSDHAPQILAGR